MNPLVRKQLIRFRRAVQIIFILIVLAMFYMAPRPSPTPTATTTTTVTIPEARPDLSPVTGISFIVYGLMMLWSAKIVHDHWRRGALLTKPADIWLYTCTVLFALPPWGPGIYLWLNLRAAPHPNWFTWWTLGFATVSWLWFCAIVIRTMRSNQSSANIPSPKPLTEESP